MVDWRAILLPIVKLYIYCTEKVELHFSIYLLCQVKNPDEKNTRHVYLLGNANVVNKFSSSNLLELENLSTTFAEEFQADSG